MRINSIINSIIKGEFIPRIRGLLIGLRYKSCKTTSIIYKPIKFTARELQIGSRVYVYKHCRIECIKEYEGIKYNPQIIFGDDVSIQQNAHITCANKISIGARTSLSSNVTVTDINHPYEDINSPIERQQLEVLSVCIGEDSKIYNNTVILPGSRIGKHCVIGANAVVANDIPDYSVAVGMPAKIIKRYDFELKEWRKTNPDGSFI